MQLSTNNAIMSTSIGEIEGHCQISEKHLFTVKWGDSKIHLNRFHGGEKGSMLQLTIIEGNRDYIMLTKDQVDSLITLLSESFDYDKHPSE